MTQKPKTPDPLPVVFPKSEGFQQERKSLLRACGGNANAAQLLGYLLGCTRYGNEEAGSETRTVIKTQGQIVDEMPHPLSTRTLRDDARPCLVELGYLTYEDLKNSRQQTAFRLLIPQIQQGVSYPENVPDYRTLSYFQALKQKRADRRKKQTDRIRFRTNEDDGTETFPNENSGGSETSPHGWETSPIRLGNVTAWLGNVTDTQATIYAASREDLGVIFEYLNITIRYSLRSSNKYMSDAASADITGTPSSLFSDFTDESEERDHPDLQSLEGENADGDMAHPGLAPQSGWSAVFSSSCVHATGMESGRVETETKSDEASATLQTSAQTQTVTDSYSQPCSEIGAPPVSLSEQNTAIPIISGQRQGEVSAVDENDTHSQFDSVENVPEWAQGATNGTGIDSDYSAVSSHPGGTNRDGARASRVASRDGQPGAVHHATGGNHTARSVAARSEVDDGSMGTGCGRDTGTLSDPARSNGGHQSRAGAREPEAAHDQRSSALGESAQSAGHCEPADLLRRNAGGQRGAGRAGTVKDEAVGTDKGNKGAGRKAKKDHPLSPEERERWRKWKKIIMDNRGGELQDQGKIINEAEEIKKVLARFNDAQLHTIWWYMTTQHFKWSKPDFKHTIGGYALNHEANGIKKTLEELRKWPEDSVPGKPLSPDTWETTPPLVRSGTGYQNMNAKMAAMAKQFALVPRGE